MLANKTRKGRESLRLSPLFLFTTKLPIENVVVWFFFAKPFITQEIIKQYSDNSQEEPSY